MRGIQTKTRIPQGGESRRGIRMTLQFDPALGALRSMVEARQTLFARHGMGPHDSNRIAGPQDRGHIVRLVHPFHEHGQIGLAAGRHRFDPGFSLGRHGAIVRHFPMQAETT